MRWNAVQLKRLDPIFTVCKISDCALMDITADYCFFSKTDEELSLVCPQERVPANVLERSDGWKGFRIEGTLDFSLIGILARISAILAAEKIGIFVVSTYNTDYVFVKKENFDRAVDALSQAGYEIVE